MVYRCLITLFSTWSDFNWQPETVFFFASNRWIQGSTRKRHADFSRAWHRKGCMKLNGEMDFEGSEIPFVPLLQRGRLSRKDYPSLKKHALSTVEGRGKGRFAQIESQKISEDS